MNCKYCHDKNHQIDKCPNIICKKCNEQGHPQWLCSEITKNNNFSYNNSNNSNNSNNNYSNNYNNNNNNKYNKNSKYNNKDIVDKTGLERIEKKKIFKKEKNLCYYIELEKLKWGDIILDILDE